MWLKNVALRKPTWIGGRNVGKNNKTIARRSNLSAWLIISYIKSGNLNACLFKEFYKDMISTHALFYSTRLYAGYRKQTYQTAFLWWMMKWSYSQNWKQTSCCLTLVKRFAWKGLDYLAESCARFKAKRKGYKHHPASERICKHFIRSCKTDFVK